MANSRPAPPSTLARRSATALASPSSPRAQMVTLHPSDRSAFADAKPSPRVDPVTIAILSVSPRCIVATKIGQFGDLAMWWSLERDRRITNSPNDPIPSCPSCPSGVSHPLVQEPAKRVVEGRRLLHVGHVAGTANHHQL